MEEYNMKGFSYKLGKHRSHINTIEYNSAGCERNMRNFDELRGYRIYGLPPHFLTTYLLYYYVSLKICSQLQFVSEAFNNVLRVWFQQGTSRTQILRIL